MKRLLSIIAILVFIITIAGGCTKKKPVNGTDDPVNQTQQVENSGEDNTYENIESEMGENLTDYSTDDSGDYDYIDGTPSGGYTKYSDAKYAAYDRITAKIDENEELIWYSVALLPFTMIDLRLITVAALTSDDAATTEMALGFFFDDVDCSISGDTYTIKYKDTEGNTNTDTCTYDAAKDSLKMITTDGSGKETLIFEYVKVAEGEYASQYYYENDENGGFEMLALFFDDNEIGFGIKSVSSKPASIFGETGTGIDFVKDCDTYYILDGDAFTVFEEGTESVY